MFWCDENMSCVLIIVVAIQQSATAKIHQTSMTERGYFYFFKAGAARSGLCGDQTGDLGVTNTGL